MPTYTFSEPSTGLKIKLTGDTPPTQEQVAGAFETYKASRSQQVEQPPAQQFAPEDPRSDVLREPQPWWQRLGSETIKAAGVPSEGVIAPAMGRIRRAITGAGTGATAGSRLEQEGPLALFAAPPEKREAGRQIFESLGNVVGPKTAAAAGVIGETAADILASPGGMLTLGVSGGLKSLAAAPEAIAAAGDVAQAADLLAAARTARVTQGLERTAIAGFAAPTAESAVAGIQTAKTVLESDATPEEKVRAVTQAAIPVAFAAALGVGAREAFKGKAVEPSAPIVEEPISPKVEPPSPEVAEVKVEPAVPTPEAAPAAEAITPPVTEPTVAMAAEPAPSVADQPEAVPPIISPEGMQPRAFAERVVAKESLPAEVRQQVAESPVASYLPQNVKEVVKSASEMSQDQLVSDIANNQSNTRVASGMELFNRMVSEGRMEDAANLSLSLAESGTRWGQLINQFKLLNASNPDGFLMLITKAAEKAGRKISTETANKLKSEMENLNAKKAEMNSIDTTLRQAVEADAPKGALDLLYKERDTKLASFGEANTALNQAVAEANPASAADLYISTVQGSVMAPLSTVRNVIGNTINIPARELADAAAAVIDATVTGNKNNIYDINARTIGRIKAFTKALPQAAKVILKGSDAIPYEISTDVGNPLNFQRGWKNVFEAIKQGKEGVLSRKFLRDGYEATFGVYPDIMLRLATATDIPFKAAQRASVIEELGRKGGLTDKQIELAKNNIDLVKISKEDAAKGRKGLTQDQIDQIEFEAARAVYQQDNAATAAVGNVNRFIKNKAGSAGYIPYRLMSLFQKTPINVLGEVLSFTPIAGLWNLGKDVSAREKNIVLGKQIVGLMAVNAFSHLYDKGILSPNLDSPNETEKARQLSISNGVQPPGTINLSGLKRYIDGKDHSFKPGDEVLDLYNMGVAGALGQMVGTAKRVKEQGRADENDLMAVGWGGLMGQLNFVMQQSFLKGTADFIGLINSDPRNSFQKFARGVLVTAGSPLAPSILGAIDRANREFVPVTKDETFIKSAVNEFNKRVNILDTEKLPLKRNMWGEGIPQTPKGENPWIYNLIDPIRSRAIPADPLNADIYKIWRRTSDEAVIPSLPSPKLTYGGVQYDKLTPQQYDRFAQLVGFFRRTYAEKVYMSGAFSKASDEDKISMLNQAYGYGLREGKEYFFDELKQKGEELKPLAKKRGFAEQ